MHNIKLKTAVVYCDLGNLENIAAASHILYYYLLCVRFDHGGFGGGGGGGGNSRWVEESREEGDWSKPTPRNERLEQ